MNEKERLEREKKWKRKSTALLVLAAVAFIVGLVLEILGYDAVVEGIIVAFALFITQRLEGGFGRLEDSLGNRFDRLENRFDRLDSRLESLNRIANQILNELKK